MNEATNAVARALNRCVNLAGKDSETLTAMAVDDTVEEIVQELSGIEGFDRVEFLASIYQ